MVVIAKVPFSQGSMNRNQGCEKAPNEIINHLKTMFSKESGENPSIEISEIAVSKENSDQTYKNIKSSQADIYLGGDHSITYASFQTLNSENKYLIIFDAHPDLDTSTNTPTHEDYLTKLIQENKVNPENIILIGIRNYGANELQTIKEKKIKTFTSKQIFEYGIKDIADSITESIPNNADIYLSIDIDAIDPAFAPGTGMPEPAGLSSRELIYIVQRLKNIKKADIVEVNPEKDINNTTTRLAARVLKEIIK